MPSPSFDPIEHPVAGNPPLAPFVARISPAPAIRVAHSTTLTVRETTVRPHPDLPAIPAWGYGLWNHPSSPGPLLEVDAGTALQVRWRNRLSGPQLPFFTSIVAGDDPADSTQNHPGVGTGMPQDTGHSPLGWLSTHLHGAHVGPDSDGWPDNLIPPGVDQVCQYANDDDNADLGLAKVGAALWYHDHAMNATRYHVYAGLAGGYLVRHPDEGTLGLPTSAAEGEAVLLVQDRNLGVDADGQVRFLHKTTDSTAEFFGPVTIVNGRIWPRMTVADGVVRLRLYNGSNSRTYRLHLLDDAGAGLGDRVLVIGTEGGLSWRATRVGADGGLLLAPAERLDLLVDLRGLADGHVYVVNSADAPFSAQDAPAPADVTTPRPPARLAYPQVMRLDVRAGRSDCVPGSVWDDLANGTVLNPAYRRLVHAAGAPDPTRPPHLELPHDHGHRLVVLSESDPPGHLQLTEVVPDPEGHIEIQLPTEAAPRTYRDVGSSFYQTVGIMPVVGQWEVWRFLNTTGDTHPMHIHQSTFQPLGDAGTAYVTSDVQPDGSELNRFDQLTHTTRAPLVPDPAATGRAYEPHEVTSWKDTLRVDPGNLVSVAIRFDRPGRYVYHCHIIEHEDTEMMRPFVVTPVAMDMGNGGGHHH